MEERLRNLDDATAIRILTTIARPRLRDGGLESELTTEVRQALQEGFASPDDAGAASAGELARQARRLFAEDPGNRQAIEVLLERESGHYSFAIGETVAVVTAALVVLQTHVKIERDKDGKLSWLIEKKPTEESLLKELVKKLLSFVPSGS